MYYDLINDTGFRAAHNRLDSLRMLKQSVTIEVYKKTRTTKQNAALHLFFKQVSDLLNNAGATMESVGGMEIPFTETIIKEVFWKPIQLVMFDTSSTTKLTTEQMNDIVDIIALHVAEKIGESITFPSLESMII